MERVEHPALSDLAMPLISLDAIGADCLGLLILVRSGVMYTAQTGGIYCTHPSAEGVFMPIGTLNSKAPWRQCLRGQRPAISMNEPRAESIIFSFRSAKLGS